MEKIENISWKDYVSNETVLQRVGEKRHLIKTNREGKAIWIGHVSLRNTRPIQIASRFRSSTPCLSKLQLQLTLLSVFSWISWTGSYNVTKIRPNTTSFFYPFRL